MDPELYNWQRLDDRVTTSGRITPTDLDALAEMGTRCIVNLAPDGVRFALADEAEEVARRGMAYVQIPVAFDNPTEADFARFREVMAERAHARVHIHCIANWRVSAFIFRYRRDVLGWDETTARVPMEAIWHPDSVWMGFLTPLPPAPPPVQATSVSGAAPTAPSR